MPSSDGGFSDTSPICQLLHRESARRILRVVEHPIAVFAAASLDEHVAPEGHPEFPGRLDASLEGIGAADLGDAVRLEWCLIVRHANR